MLDNQCHPYIPSTTVRVRVYNCEPKGYEPMASASSQLSPASFLLHQSAELPKNTPFWLTKTCSCRMIPWARKRGRLALKRRFVLQITLESISEGLSFKIFLRGACPQTPLVCALRALPSTTSNSVPPLFFIPGSAPVYPYDIVSIVCELLLSSIIGTVHTLMCEYNHAWILSTVRAWTTCGVIVLQAV